MVEMLAIRSRLLPQITPLTARTSLLPSKSCANDDDNDNEDEDDDKQPAIQSPPLSTVSSNEQNRSCIILLVCLMSVGKSSHLHTIH